MQCTIYLLDDQCQEFVAHMVLNKLFRILMLVFILWFRSHGEVVTKKKNNNKNAYIQ